MSDGTAFCAAGVRLKKVRGLGLRCETGHSFIHSSFSFRSSEASGEPKVLLEEFLFGPVKPLENLRFSERN